MPITPKKFKEAFLGRFTNKSIKQGIILTAAVTVLPPLAAMTVIFGFCALETFSQPSMEIRLAEEKPTRYFNAMRWTCDELKGTPETTGDDFSCRVDTKDRENSIEYSAGTACKEGLGRTFKITRDAFTCKTL